MLEVALCWRMLTGRVQDAHVTRLHVLVDFSLVSRCLDDDKTVSPNWCVLQISSITLSSITTILLQNVLKAGIRVCTS
jgi:hypothetical protein